MPKFPTITDQQLRYMMQRIKLAARDSYGNLRIVDVRRLNPRTDPFTVTPSLLGTVDKVNELAIVPVLLPLFLMAKEVRSTIYEVYAQLLYPLHPEAMIIKQVIGRVSVLEILSKFVIREDENCMVAFARLYTLE